MEIIIYITVNLLLFSSWHILLFRNKDNLSFVDRVLGVFVLGLAQIVVTEMVLGVLLKKLYATPLFALNISISLAVITIAMMKRKADLVPHRNNLSISFLSDGGISNIFVNAFNEIKDKTIRFFQLMKNDWILLTVFILFLIYFCYLIFTGYLFPSYAWDSLLYHLPTVGFILQSGAIENIPYNSLIYTFINVFPKNIDLFFLWNIIFLRSDSIIDLSQLPFTIAGMLAIYGIGRKLGIRAKYAVYSSLLFFFAPIIILQSTTNYVDIAVSVLFLIALNFILRRDVLHEKSSSEKSAQAIRYEGNGQLFLAGVTSGILLGSKGSGPLFVIALSVLFVINELRISYSLKQAKHSDVLTSLHAKHLTGKMIVNRYLLYFMVPVLLLGSYWYISNWVHYGNPVYPFVVKLFGKVLFKGTFSEILHTGPDMLREMPLLKKLIHVWLERVEYYYYASDVSGFGPLWFILLLPCMAFTLFLSLWKKKTDLLIVSFMIILVFLVYPNNWFTRYVIFLFALGCLSFGIVIQNFEKKGRTFQYIALFIVMYTFLASHSPTVTPVKIREFARLSAAERTIPRLEPYILNMSQKKHYGLWSWVSSSVSEGDTLAYSFTPEMLSILWNSSFSNKAIFIKAGKFKDWLEKLQINNVTHVVVLIKPRSMEYFWLEKLRDMGNVPQWTAISKKFTLQYQDENYAVFRFQ